METGLGMYLPLASGMATSGMALMRGGGAGLGGGRAGVSATAGGTAGEGTMRRVPAVLTKKLPTPRPPMALAVTIQILVKSVAESNTDSLLDKGRGLVELVVEQYLREF